MTKAVKNSKRHPTGGFTLTELMVASAIFVILMSALATLFNAAVSTTRQGYASIEAHDTARAVTSTITRDLTVAFTAREHGDVYNFYGRPDGFMFVGGLEGGNLGRVSYVFHEEVASPPIVTTVTERWGDVVANVQRQARRVGREMGLYGDDIYDPIAGTGVVPDAVARLVLYYGTHAADDTVEFEVEIVRESLVRLEEAGANDLDTFNLLVKDSPVINLDWSQTYVDPIDPARDSLSLGPLDADNQLPQFQFLVGALDPTPLTAGDDLRDLYIDINRTPSVPCPDGGWTHPVSGECISLRILGPQTFEQMLQSRKREFWLRMLSDDLGGFTPLDLQPVPTDGSTGYWYDEGFGVPNARNQRNLNAHVLATGIIGSVSVRQPGTDTLIESVLGSGVAMDLLDAEPRFSYGDAQTMEDWPGADGLDNDDDGLIDAADIDEVTSPSYWSQASYLHYFNDLENLRDSKAMDHSTPASGPGSIPAMLLYGNDIAEQDLVYVDGILADNVLGNRGGTKNLGSPLLPRIPAVVTLDFWVTRAKTRPGAPDFRRRFTQSIMVPSAQGRAVTSTIALGPGASL